MRRNFGIFRDAINREFCTEVMLLKIKIRTQMLVAKAGVEQIFNALLIFFKGFFLKAGVVNAY